MSEELLKMLPQQWIGLCVLLMFIVFIIGQLAEKYETIARIIPFGKLWHDHAQKKVDTDAAKLTDAIEAARRSWSHHENAALATLESRVAIIKAVSDQQSDNIEQLQEAIRCFTAFSVYDARWHHRVDILLADSPCQVPQHLDYFSFETLWKQDPATASRLPA